MTAIFCRWFLNSPEEELCDPLMCFLCMAVIIDFSVLASMVDLPSMVGIQ